MDGHMSDSTPNKSPALKLLAVLVALAALFLVGRQAAGYLSAVIEWTRGFGAWSAAVFVAIYSVAVVAFVPGSILTLAGGILFGVALGSVVVFTGASLGATLAFLVSRYLARARVSEMIAGDTRFAAIDEAIGRNGLKIAFLLRLSPAVPFILLNYALGLTRVRLRDYVLALLGMIPGTVLYVYGGAAIGSVAALAGGESAPKTPAHYALFGVGLLATLVVTVVITRTARRALAEATAEKV